MDRRQLMFGSLALGAAYAMPVRAAVSAPSSGALQGNGEGAKFTGTNGRPPEQDRHFRSVTIERTITAIRGFVGSPELAQIFENCFPNTLDTTVFPGSLNGHPDTYVITGDIDAMWLRDSAAQVWPYLEFAREDGEIRSLLEGVIRRQARLILLDSYANAFTRNISDPPLSWSLQDKTDMTPGVAERKWEIDSLCYPVRLAHGFWKATGSKSPFDQTWREAAHRIVKTFREQQRKTSLGPYHFQRSSPIPTDTLPMSGYGFPIKPVGLICSGFRPSDDACIYSLFIPANLFALATLARIGEIAKAVYADAELAKECDGFHAELLHAIEQYGVVKHPKHGEMYAYEVDGYGNALLMDDANAPGLLSLGYLELCSRNDPRCNNARAFALSEDNPYFFRGKAGEGIGGPHVGRGYIWPMSVLMRALTSNSDAEISTCLQTLCRTTGGTNFMHEAFQQDNPSDYTRAWFAWANGLFGELVLKLRRERPTLLRDFRVQTAG